MKINYLTLVSATFLLVACASSPPPYQPATSSTSVGYSHTVIEANRYRITYRGGDQATANDYALLRAAELTLANNQTWFQTLNTSTREQVSKSGPDISVGGALGSYGGHTSTGLGLGIGFPLGGSTPMAARTIEIITGTGPKPNDSNAYDAQSVANSIRMRLNSTSK